jgi:hypothetical protein
MNERIKELAEQAGVQFISHIFTANGNGSGVLLDDLDLEKFAELIVAEHIDCIAIMEKIANSSNASIPKDYDKYTYLKTLDDLKGLLKVHFGVEE